MYPVAILFLTSSVNLKPLGGGKGANEKRKGKERKGTKERKKKKKKKKRKREKKEKFSTCLSYSME